MKILDKIEFPSGKQFHHNRALFEKIKRKEFEPYCFHMCWTAGKADKLKFLKQDGLWYLEESCVLEEPGRGRRGVRPAVRPRAGDVRLRRGELAIGGGNCT